MWVQKKNIVGVILISVLTGYVIFSYMVRPGEIPHPLKGQKAPDLTIKMIDGSEVQLSSLVKDKKAVVIDFWATWCGPCRKALPDLERLARKYDSNQVIFLAVNVYDGDVRAIEKFINENGIKTVSIFMEKDNSTGQKYLFKGIPAIFVLDDKMQVQEFYSGYSSSLESRIKQTVDTLLSKTL